mgnify:CR=1 FL=1
MSKRSEKMKNKTVKQLQDFIKSGSLSASAASYELKKRERQEKSNGKH